MRWTGPNSDVRDVPADELWVGIVDVPRPHITLATRTPNGEPVVSRFHPDVAREIGEELIRRANQLSAENN